MDIHQVSISRLILCVRKSRVRQIFLEQPREHAYQLMTMGRRNATTQI